MPIKVRKESVGGCGRIKIKTKLMVLTDDLGKRHKVKLAHFIITLAAG